jgi:proline iminopeptidase
MIKKKVKVGNYNVMTYSCGVGDEVLLLLHGGPGVPCNYLLDTHADYVKYGFKVVSWDQLGCGESDCPDDKNLWEIPRFVNEVESVRRALNLKRVHLLGQSWGGVLGLEYTLKYTKNVKSFIIANSAFNLLMMQDGFIKLKNKHGKDTIEIMRQFELEGRTDESEYRIIYDALSRKHICNLADWPDQLKYSMENIASEVLSEVFGPYLFNCTGKIKNYDRTGQLHLITQPCLIIHGEHDYIVSECAEWSRDHLPNSELHIMKGCSHMPFYEDPETYHKILTKFLIQNAG